VESPRICRQRALPAARDGELKEPPPYNINSSWQTSIGFQRQVGAVSAVEVDYIFNQSRDEGWQQQNANIASIRRPASITRFRIAACCRTRSSASWR
jgi:hypothetical protein